MKIALITTDKFTDFNLLKIKLDEINATEIICGNNIAYELSMEYKNKNEDIIVTMAEGDKAYSAYNAIKEVETVVIFTNGNGSAKKTRTNLAINKALNTNKKLLVYPYKASVLDIKHEDEYIKIDFQQTMKKACNIDGIYLNQEQVKKLISNLQAFIEVK